MIKEEFIVSGDQIDLIHRVFDILQIKISFEKMPDGFLAKNPIICGIPLMILLVAITLYLAYILATPFQGSPLLFIPVGIVFSFSGFVFNNLSHAINGKYKATVDFN